MSSNVYAVAAVTLGAVLLAAVYQLLFRSAGDRKVLKVDEFQEFPLIQKTVISHNTAVYRFGLPRPTDCLGLPIGQHISVCANIDGKEIVRSYTPTSCDDDKGFFDLLVKTYATGNVSRIIGNLNIGDSIRVKGPKGQFRYTPNMCREINMVAGGTGITPMYQILNAVTKNPEDKTQINLIFANVNPEDILFKKELDDCCAAYKNVKVYYVLNNPPEGWTGGCGFVTADILKEQCCPAADDVKLLICGPPPMVSAVKKAAMSLGFAKAKPVSKLEDQVFAF
ncbi:NADH-cytochrome b5 reductase 1 [Trichomonascus vanleenenianus]|uniref:cytochrome-b5 reductase n=1 Tax=Trichomonascus vanleenenianus TaxID=2268995 RepID=UPI003ECA3033